MLVPSSGEGRPVPPAAHLPTMHVSERYGLVWAWPGEPVARIQLPGRVPLGFHGSWIPDA